MVLCGFVALPICLQLQYFLVCWVEGGVDLCTKMWSGLLHLFIKVLSFVVFCLLRQFSLMVHKVNSNGNPEWGQASWELCYKEVKWSWKLLAAVARKFQVWSSVIYAAMVGYVVKGRVHFSEFSSRPLLVFVEVVAGYGLWRVGDGDQAQHHLGLVKLWMCCMNISFGLICINMFIVCVINA